MPPPSRAADAELDDLVVERCDSTLTHAAHTWRPDGRKITARSPRRSLRRCKGREPAPTSNVAAVRRFVASLEDPDVALVQLALTLADELDNAEYRERPNVPGTAKELRGTLADLRSGSINTDDPGEALQAGMSSPSSD